ncbi:hypothetical protein PpBr36_04874 [Pyricularia pennisetigena]|uniref:hypothetical protein n=1 Tax=Pyricularia pennisetigena TaxID=1578925 RepID=UPI00115457F1|nr:hypothetical protein PpBr36_04874 [Pyricularia pennisetigena]TLS26139.1 hypothetical protein PpBr36_04874 [Pyricularia pennisetigena]
MHLHRIYALAGLLSLSDLGLATKRRRPPLSPNHQTPIIRCDVRLIETDHLGYESVIEEKQVAPSGTQTFQYGKDNIYILVDKKCGVLEARGLRKDHTHLEIDISSPAADSKSKKVKKKLVVG